MCFIQDAIILMISPTPTLFTTIQTLSDRAMTKRKYWLLRTLHNPDLFRFSVFKRYGAKCAVCSVSRSEMLQATHLRPVSEKGSDDPRNGLVLCANHQLAFNAYLFAFDPESLEIVFKPGVTADELGITVKNLRGLVKKPHPESVAWRYSYWKRHVGLR